jgi:hypothetical protein
MYTISIGDPMNHLLRLGGQAFLILLREGAGHLFCGNPFAEKYTVTTLIICCEPPEGFDDYKLVYYINMEYPIRADQYDLDSREAIAWPC